MGLLFWNPSLVWEGLSIGALPSLWDSFAMKQIYRLAQQSFEKSDGPTPRDKVFHMGYIDGYLAGFREARDAAALMIIPIDCSFREYRDAIRKMGEEEVPETVQSKISHEHACPEWDYLVIRPSDPEFEACLCETDPECEQCKALK